MVVKLETGGQIDRDQLARALVELQYRRNDAAFQRGTFRLRGETVDVFPAHCEDRAWRIALFGDEIESMREFDPLTGEITATLDELSIYANSHYVTPRPTLTQAVAGHQGGAAAAADEFTAEGKLLEAERLQQRTTFDIEMIETTGSCKSIENYSRYLSGRKPGEPPPTLFEYLPENALLIVDESHVTVPQIGGMARGDARARACCRSSASACRPASTTGRSASRSGSVPAADHLRQRHAGPVGDGAHRRRLRRAGDPPHRADRPGDGGPPGRAPGGRPAGRMPHVIGRGGRILVTTLTKRMAEDLTEYLTENGVKVRYLHSDVDTLERIEIIRDLRLGVFDVLVGINLLREGLDIPECALVAILDADKEGFLRSQTSLIQTIGRAARNVDGRVILYADVMTAACAPPSRRRSAAGPSRARWNEANGITPTSVRSHIGEALASVFEQDYVTVAPVKDAGSRTWSART